MLAALYATINDPDANTRQVAGVALAEVLDRRGQQQDWTALVAVLRRIQTGERDRDLLITGLDRIDTAITGRALDGLTGADIGIDPDCRHTLTDGPAAEGSGTDDDSAGAEELVALMVAAATGAGQAVDQAESVLHEWESDPELTGLVAVVRRVIGGDREPSLDDLAEWQASVVETVLATLDQQDGRVGGGGAAGDGSEQSIVEEDVMVLGEGLAARVAGLSDERAVTVLALVLERQRLLPDPFTQRQAPGPAGAGVGSA